MITVEFSKAEIVLKKMLKQEIDFSKILVRDQIRNYN
jgi:hypothetical protein